jgi:hypothetical protein
MMSTPDDKVEDRVVEALRASLKEAGRGDLDLTPGQTAVPTLLVRASEAKADWPDDWPTSWPFEHTMVEIPGNHFTTMETCADVAGRAHTSMESACLRAWHGKQRGR